jgi:hypothetical protein
MSSRHPLDARGVKHLRERRGDLPSFPDGEARIEVLTRQFMWVSKRNGCDL